MGHKLITCTGFGGTGSSVVSDLMTEFNSVKSCGDFEFGISAEIDGISDLQHYIVDDFNCVKVTEAIYRFRRHSRIISKGYSSVLGCNKKKIFNDYIDELVDVKWMGSNNLQVLRFGWFHRKWYGLCCRLKMYYSKLTTSNNGYERGYKKPKMLIELAQDEDKFFLATRKMYKRLLDSLDPDDKYKFLCFDRLVSTNNYKRYCNYFDDIKVIYVDRDPRDLYLLNQLYWHEGWIPSEDVEVFINWFRTIRKNLKRDIKDAESGTLLCIMLEDAIYNYDETIKKIIDFIGLNEKDHINKHQFFNPNYSIRNTKLWEKTNAYKENVERIKKDLSDFCYPY